MFPGLDLYYTDPAQPLTTAHEELDDLDHYLSCLFEVCKFFAKPDLGLGTRVRAGVGS